MIGVSRMQSSGRNWKEPSQRASSVKNPILTTSWEKKMAEKAAHQRYKEVKHAAIDARKQKLQVCISGPAPPLSSKVRCHWHAVWLLA